MDFKRGLTFVTQDQNWLSKVGVGTLISLVPILNFAGIGYSMDVTRNVAQGRETPLPEWSDLGNQFVRGLLGTVVQFLWSLPILLVACPLYAVVLTGVAATSQGEDVGTGGSLAIAGVGLLIALGALALAPFTMVAFTRYAITNSFSEAMPGPVLREMRGHFRPWGSILLAALAFGVLFGVFSICTFGIGYLLIIPLAFYVQLVVAHWYAQAHRESTGGYATPPSMV